MNFEKQFKSQLLFAIAVMVFGVIALVVFVLLALKGTVGGNIFVYTGTIAIGFLLGGIILAADYFITSRNPSRKKRIEKQMELNNEERQMFIRTKSGNEAFGFSLWLVMGLWGLNLLANVSLNIVLPFVLGFMFLSYFVSMVVNTQKILRPVYEFSRASLSISSCTGIGYSPVKHAVQNESAGRLTDFSNPSRLR